MVSVGTSTQLKEDRVVEGLHQEETMGGKWRHLHWGTSAALAVFQVISFNIAHRKARHLHLDTSATDAESQGILFTIAPPLGILSSTIIK
jgi:hypothetical protein